jgi:hypothetical protein
VCIMAAVGSTVLSVLQLVLSSDDVEQLNEFAYRVLHIG